MSTLLCFKKEFIEYLYDNDLKIHTHENVCHGDRIRGCWAFLYKYDKRGYISQLSYCIDKDKQLISIRWDEIKHIAPIVIFYVISILGCNHNMHICYTRDEICKFKLKRKDCILCKCFDDKNNCLICESKKNNDNPVFEIINEMEMIETNDYKRDKTYIAYIEKMYDVLIPKTYFSSEFIRNYMEKNDYIIGTQEYLHPIVPNHLIDKQSFYCSSDNVDGMYGCFYVRKKGDSSSNDNTTRILVNFTYNSRQLCVDIDYQVYNLNNPNDANINDTKPDTIDDKYYDVIKMLLLHLISSSSYIEDISVRLSNQDINLFYILLSRIGFMLSNHETKSFHVVPFFKINNNNKNCTIVNTTRKKVLSYIEHYVN